MAAHIMRLLTIPFVVLNTIPRLANNMGSERYYYDIIVTIYNVIQT